MRRDPILKELAQNDPVFQRLLSDLITTFGVDEVTSDRKGGVSRCNGT